MLAVDTVSNICSVACAHNELIAIRKSTADVKNTDVVLNMVLAVCEEVGISVSDIKHLLVTNGPGTFTGVRVGVVLCQMLAYANSSMIYPISSTLAHAYTAWGRLGDGKYAVILDARMGEYYYAEYEINSLGFSVLREDSRINLIDMANMECDFLVGDVKLPNIVNAAVEVESLLALKEYIRPTSIMEANPLYLRDPV